MVQVPGSAIQTEAAIWMALPGTWTMLGKLFDISKDSLLGARKVCYVLVLNVSIARSIIIYLTEINVNISMQKYYFIFNTNYSIMQIFVKTYLKSKHKSIWTHHSKQNRSNKLTFTNEWKTRVIINFQKWLFTSWFAISFFTRYCKSLS